MSLFYCPICNTLIANSHICTFGCGDTYRITHIDINGQNYKEEEHENFNVLIKRKEE